MKSIVGSLLNRVPIPVGRLETLFSLPSSSSREARGRHLGAMEKQSTIFAIVDRIATGVASATWRLYRKAKDPEDREEVLVHPALSVWNKPNPHFTRDEFVETMFQHYELTGEWWWVLARSELLRGNGPPIELWPVRPDRMDVVPHPTKFIAGFTYQAGNELIPLDVRDVIYNKRPNPLDPYRGIGPIGTLLIDIEGEAAASQWNTQFFRSGAEPGGLLKFDHRLSPGEYQEQQERWRMAHAGVSNAHRVGILESGAEWVDRKFSMRDMQFEQLRRYSKATFMEAWGFPKSLLGDVEDVNRANAEAGSFVFDKWLMVPRLNKLRTTLNDDYLPQFGSLAQGLEFDYDEVVKPDPAEVRAEKRARVLSATGFVKQGFDPEAVLETFGFPPMPWIGLPGDRSALLLSPDGVDGNGD